MWRPNWLSGRPVYRGSQSLTMSALVFTGLFLPVLVQPGEDRRGELFFPDAGDVAGVLDLDDRPVGPHLPQRFDGGPLEPVLVADDHGRRNIDRFEIRF